MEEQVMDSGRMDYSPYQVSSCSTDDSMQQGPRTVDSGYASNESSQLKDTPKRYDWISILKRKPQIPRSRSFESITIVPSVRQRYNDLQELFSDPLCKQLASTCSRIGALSFKLKALGETRENAKPFVVVQCKKKISKKVQQFFSQSHVKAQYQPGDGIQPDLEVIVRPWPPVAKALDVHFDLYSPEHKKNIADFWPLEAPQTTCGLLIKADVGDITKFATMGGLLAISGMQRRDIKGLKFEASGVPKIYGITVGHIFTSESVETQDDTDDTDSDGENSDAFEGEEGLDDPLADGFEVEEDLDDPLLEQDIGTRDECASQNDSRLIPNEDKPDSRITALIKSVDEPDHLSAEWGMIVDRSARLKLDSLPSPVNSTTSEQRQAYYRENISKQMKYKIGAENLLEALSSKDSEETKDQRMRVELELDFVSKVIVELESKLQQEIKQSKHLTKLTQEYKQVTRQHDTEEQCGPGTEYSQNMERVHGRDAPSSVSKTTWVHVGQTIRSSTVSRNGMSLDWALAEITDVSYLEAQQFNFRPAQTGTEHTDSTQSLIQRMEQACGKDVLVNSSKGVRKGTLVDSLSFLLLNSAWKLTPTYSVRFWDDAGVQSGECGSLVIDANDHQVYGHIVASDSFHEAYVIPFCEIVRDIREELEADRVGIASYQDIMAARETLIAKQEIESRPRPDESSLVRSKHPAIDNHPAHTTRAGPMLEFYNHDNIPGLVSYYPPGYTSSDGSSSSNYTWSSSEAFSDYTSGTATSLTGYSSSSSAALGSPYSLSPLPGSSRRNSVRDSSSGANSSHGNSIVEEEAGGSSLRRSTPGTRYSCLFEGCMADFSRLTDLKRHMRSVHDPENRLMDCPYEWCGRTGTYGFTRADHLREHVREVHKGEIPKARRRT